MEGNDDQFLAISCVLAVLTFGTIILGRWNGNVGESGTDPRSESGWPASAVVRLSDPALDASKKNFILVEFGDYQCPPCRAAFPRVESILARHRGELAFTFRHLPLTRIHPNALPAARLAEAARRKGRFTAMHRKLFSDPRGVSSSTLRLFAREEGLDPKVVDDPRADSMAQIGEDTKAAQRLGLGGTPSFALLLPHGRAIPIELTQVEEAMEKVRENEAMH